MSLLSTCIVFFFFVLCLVESDACLTNVRLLNPHPPTTSTPLSLLSHDNSSEIYRASSGTSRGCAYLNITDTGVGQVSLSGCVSLRNWFCPRRMRSPKRGGRSYKKKRRLTRIQQTACSLLASKSFICSHVFSASSERILARFLKRVGCSRNAYATRAYFLCFR